MSRPTRAAQRAKAQADYAPPTLETVLKLKTPAFRGLPSEYEHAALAIEAGYRVVVRGLLSKSAALQRTPRGKHEMTDAEDELANAYRSWARVMERQRILITPVIDVLVDGSDPHDCDIRDRRPSGWTAERVIAGLKIAAQCGLGTYSWGRLARQITP